jgi:uncharacterized cupredoxin-like copper-binding protein
MPAIIERRSRIMHHRAIAAALAVVFIGLFPLAALSHGDSGHAKPKAVDPAMAEETAFGRAGDAKKVGRTIRIRMDDRMRFVAAAARQSDVHAGHPPHAMPGDLVVTRGETVRFLVRNDGKVMHEMVIGTMKELKEHAELMRRFPDMEHDEPHMSHVAPGRQGEIVWQFTQPGEFHYACLIPGHMEAGMIAKITVK